MASMLGLARAWTQQVARGAAVGSRGLHHFPQPRPPPASHHVLVESVAGRAAVPSWDGRRPKALFLDAAGTFLVPSESVADVYLRYSRPYGVDPHPDTVLRRFRQAYNEPPGSTAQSVRYVGDARDFWRRVVFRSLDTDREEIFAAIYDYYTRAEAWTVPPGLTDALTRVRAAGVKVCVLSNFDDRLRPLLREMGLAGLFDAVVISCEVGAEKPNPSIFEAACAQCGVHPPDDLVVHVGDDRRNDVWGARACGITGWLWGTDVTSFEEVADRIVTGYTEL